MKRVTSQQKNRKAKASLPKELRFLTIDTSRYANKKSSTDILKELRYSV